MTYRATKRPTRADPPEADQPRPRTFLRQIDCGAGGGRSALEYEPTVARGLGARDSEGWERSLRCY